MPKRQRTSSWDFFVISGLCRVRVPLRSVAIGGFYLEDGSPGLKWNFPLPATASLTTFRTNMIQIVNKTKDLYVPLSTFRINDIFNN